MSCSPGTRQIKTLFFHISFCQSVCAIDHCVRCALQMYSLSFPISSTTNSNDICIYFSILLLSTKTVFTIGRSSAYFVNCILFHLFGPKEIFNILNATREKINELLAIVFQLIVIVAFPFISGTLWLLGCSMIYDCIGAFGICLKTVIGRKFRTSYLYSRNLFMINEFTAPSFSFGQL